MNINKAINKKSFSRFFAIQILFAYIFNNKEDNILDLISFLEKYYIADEFSLKDPEEYKDHINVGFMQELLVGTVRGFEEINLILNESLTGKYNFNVIDALIKVILMLAMYEFKYTDTERKIIINEYVDIAGEYFDNKAISFVNATLDNLSKTGNKDVNP